jgi:serine/threonine-protein kinase
MNCPSCTTRLEPNARFCGVCGYRLPPTRAPDGGNNVALGPAGAAPQRPSSPATPGAPRNGGAPLARGPANGLGPSGAVPQAQAPQQQQSKPAPARGAKPKSMKGDEMYLNQVLNNRFKIESKIGEGGFGAVYRGTQLATGRKVALKLLHPEMTKDENLVARFRREGMVLCNLRDAHTITTYDFDQTPDGTLYIAMELLEGKSLHQIFHAEAPLDWKRVFKILTEMCTSLAEAHEQGIVHRDLKPENVYLEHRPGNPEFVKILDFGIAKVMRGDAIDPQSPQLTATGQTLGTLEYMSPEQLMGKQLDGRSDVYALGVVAYEMITGRLPFPDAKGPAGLITAQLKQTPVNPSVANPKVSLPPGAERVILKALEKDKNNRYADVTAMAGALQEELDTARDAAAVPHAPAIAPQAPQGRAQKPQEMLSTVRGDGPVGAPRGPGPRRRRCRTAMRRSKARRSSSSNCSSNNSSNSSNSACRRRPRACCRRRRRRRCSTSRRRKRSSSSR